jgi:hypothetical protein
MLTEPFLYFLSNKFESPYYTSLWLLFSGLMDEKCKSGYMSNKWEFFDSYLTNIELIPYHSEGISLPGKLSQLQLNYLTMRFNNSLNFIVKFNPKLFIFNGNPWYILLIKHGLVQKYEKVQVSEKFNIYFFEIKKCSMCNV